VLDRLPDWERIYTDEIAVVHARRNKTLGTGRSPATSTPRASIND